MEQSFHFQVNLGGMLDILSNHLYKSPDVFLRELLQNGVDAITLRKKREPGFKDGKITISLKKGNQMEFRDNGAGLTEEEIHQFLAVIGQSSKQELEDGRLPEDYIGRFGIGLLSCFMVSDSIVIHTRSVMGGKTYVWTGLPDGTYTLQALEDEGPIGTTVILKAKPEALSYYNREKIEEIVRYYGLVLPVPIYFAGEIDRINFFLPNLRLSNRGQLLSLGEELFSEEFIEAIPIHTKHLEGVAYVRPYATQTTVKSGHRIYLKNMLLTENGETLLPSWAFFLQCFLNTKELKPTASREDFYEDKELEEARKEFAEEVKRHLERLQTDSIDSFQILGNIIEVHSTAIKSMAVWDNDLFKIFIDYLPFVTSEGRMTGASLRQSQMTAFYVPTVEKFKQLKPIFLARGQLLICTGYVYDEQLLERLIRLYHLSISKLNEEKMDMAFEEATFAQRQQAGFFLEVAGKALSEFDCGVEVRCFSPNDLPVFYSLSEEVGFFRQLSSAKSMSSGIFSDTMSSLLNSVAQKPMAMLYFNMNCSLIQRLTYLLEENLLDSIVKVLYIQALLVGGHQVQKRELQIMSKELINLIDWRAN